MSSATLPKRRLVSPSIVIPQDRQEEERAILTRIRRGERIDHFETVRQRKQGSLYRVPEIVTRGRFPDGGESDSTWRTQEARHVGSDTIAPGSPQVRGLARKTKDGPQARRLLALAAIYDGATRTEAASALVETDMSVRKRAPVKA